jgi:replicative DNA helicase Mcm
VVDLIGPYVIGRNKAKLHRVEPKTKIQSYDDLLDDDYHAWLASVKFRTSLTVELGLHSRIWTAINRHRATETLMRTLEQHWTAITDEPFKEPDKTYLLNRVVGVESADYRHVYDLQIEGGPTFLVNGGLVHNCIDELDKMEDQDRSSMHEAMESQSISVAKAGITARLQCRCSILGAANPKYGRFEEAQFIADQIDLPPALMSRFDLIFAMTDKPETDRDTKITKHILNVHRRGELLRNQEFTEFSAADIERMMEETKNLEPVYTKEFLRKYVAYSKRFIPILSDEAIKLITENYLQIRKQGEGENKSVPITARQLEAYVRLSEASARARLSRTVTLEDARRAVNIVEYYLRKIAGEGGKLDIDIIATGTSRSQREQIVVLRQLIQDSAEPQRGLGLEAIIQLAGQENIPEERVRVLLKRLKESGEVYEPSSGFYRLASEGIE